MSHSEFCGRNEKQQRTKQREHAVYGEERRSKKSNIFSLMWFWRTTGLSAGHSFPLDFCLLSTQNFPNLLAQRDGGEGFLNERYLVPEHTVVHNGIVCISGHVEDLNVRTQGGQLSPPPKDPTFLASPRLSAADEWAPHRLRMLPGRFPDHPLSRTLYPTDSSIKRTRDRSNSLVFHYQDRFRPRGCIHLRIRHGHARPGPR